MISIATISAAGLIYYAASLSPLGYNVSMGLILVAALIWANAHKA